MSLGVAEIRERAWRLKRAVALERYETKAGLKERSEFARVYAEHRLLTGPGTLPAIQRVISEADEAERRRLRYLESWLGEQRAEASVAALEDEYRGWEAATSVRGPHGEVPFRRIPTLIENEGDRVARIELERVRGEKLEEAIPLQVDIVHREREALSELGLGGFVEARERLAGLSIRGLERGAVRILAATEDPYREALARQARRRIGVEPDELQRSDVWWLRRMTWMDDHFRLEPILENLRRDLSELGLPLEAEGRVRLDLQARPMKSTRSFCAALEIPDQVVLVVARSGGRADCESLLHEVGHALHFAHTDPGLAFEYRALGDTSVTEAYAILFELLALQPAWLRSAASLDGRALDDYLAAAAFLKLYKLRRQATKLLFEVEFHDAQLPGEMGGRYAEVFAGSTGVAYDPRTFLEDMDRGFWVARQLRAWMLQAVLRDRLRSEFEADWHRNPAAGRFLRELFSGGQRENASALASRFGAEGLGASPLLKEVAEWSA